jgi:UDP-N-acetyl-D-mannosaminuronate dehydrogenase
METEDHIMNKKSTVVVAGLGEIGRPLFDIVCSRYDGIGIDISPCERVETADILHVCYPYQIEDFVEETARYIELFRPAVTIINSTVAVGTTRAIAERTGTAVVNSPVRGKHARMHEEMQLYTKFVGAVDRPAGEQAAQHFESLGMKTLVLASPEATELAKLTETTYFGLIIAWAQEVERYCDKWGQNYDEIVSFYEEINCLPPVKYFPGVIGGHCVMPNIEILSQDHHSVILQAIQRSNEMKMEREICGNEAPEAVAKREA